MRYNPWSGGVVGALLLGLVLIAGCAPQANSSGRITAQNKNTMVSVSFNETDQKLIREYYMKKIPPGQAKKASLPPGQQKKLLRHSALPAGLAFQPLPRDLEARLAPLPEDYVRIRVEGSVAIMNTRTRVIYDLVEGI